jgi:hypothetical protein
VPCGIPIQNGSPRGSLSHFVVPRPIVLATVSGLMNNKAQSKSSQNVLSLQLARHHAGHERAGSSAPVSNAPVGSSSNERSLERLEAENAQLRRSVVELVLQIQALRDSAK